MRADGAGGGSGGVKPHGRDCPDRCSQCLGAPARRVASDGPVITIDGQPTGRAISNDDNELRRYYARRGGKRRKPA